MHVTGTAGSRRGPLWTALAGACGALVCCALPSVLVLLGMGGAVASVVSAAPWLVFLSRHKVWVFAAAALLIVAARFEWRLAGGAVSSRRVCPVWLGRTGRVVWWLSVVIYGIGAFVAFALGPILAWIDPA